MSDWWLTADPPAWTFGQSPQDVRGATLRRDVSGQKPGVVRESQSKEAIAAEKTLIYIVNYKCQKRKRAQKFQLVVIIIEWHIY